MTKPQNLPAGKFSTWLRNTRSALVKGNTVDVPCGACNACCRSSYFIHIRPEETRTLARIPRKLLFAAPGLPKGHWLLGHYENGRCPMLTDTGCSIYAHRPLTCHRYDCRIFSAAGLTAGDDKAPINQRIRRWTFSYPAPRDCSQYAAVQAAARFLKEGTTCFPAGTIPANATQMAILAIKVYDVFLRHNNASDKIERIVPEKIVQAVMKAKKKFETRHDP
jgi:Fe-S-cluster containining protein